MYLRIGRRVLLHRTGLCNQQTDPGRVARNPATEFASFCAAERERRRHQREEKDYLSATKNINEKQTELEAAQAELSTTRAGLAAALPGARVEGLGTGDGDMDTVQYPRRNAEGAFVWRMV